MSQQVKFYVRAGLATALAFLSALGVAITDGISGTEMVAIATATLTAAGIYLGLGFGTSLEPDVGRGVGSGEADGAASA